MRHLDGFQIADLDGISVFLFLLYELIIQLDNAPDTTAKKAIVFFRILVFNRYLLKPKVGELREVLILLNVQLYGDHIDNRITSALAQLGQDLLILIRAHEIVCQDTLHLLYAGFDNGVII